MPPRRAAFKPPSKKREPEEEPSTQQEEERKVTFSDEVSTLDSPATPPPSPVAMETKPDTELEEKERGEKRRAEEAEMEKALEGALALHDESTEDDESNESSSEQAPKPVEPWKLEFAEMAKKFAAEHPDIKTPRCCLHSKCPGNRDPANKRQKKEPSPPMHKTEWGKFLYEFRQQHKELSLQEAQQRAKDIYKPKSGRERSFRAIFMGNFIAQNPGVKALGPVEQQKLAKEALKESLKNANLKTEKIHQLDPHRQHMENCDLKKPGVLAEPRPFVPFICGTTN